MFKLQLFLILLGVVSHSSLAALRYGSKILPKNGPCNRLGSSRGSLVICGPLDQSESSLPIPKSRKSSSVKQLARQPSSFVTARRQLPSDEAEYMAYPRYSYNYGVLDGGTGDTKSAWEERSGDTVRGEYSLLEPDGTLRTVSYTADDRHGFKAVITKSRPRSTKSRRVRWP